MFENSILGTIPPSVQIVLFLLACVRIYLEIVRFPFEKLPLTQKIMSNSDQSTRFHRWGLYMSLGYVVLFAPEVLMS